MKKILVLMLCLMMAVLPAVAEETEVLTYTSDAHGFSFDYPAEMMLISPENVEKMMQMAADSNMEGINKESLEAAVGNVKNMNMVMLMTADGLFNVNAVCQEVGMKLDADLFLSMMAPATIKQYQSMFEGCEVLDEGSKFEAGENVFAAQSVEINAAGTGMNIVILYGFHETNMYVITFTAVDPMLETDENVDMVNEVVDVISSSFNYSAADAE